MIKKSLIPSGVARDNYIAAFLDRLFYSNI